MKRKNKKLEKGITLIALIITIIILLILAGVTITMLTGDNGILKMTSKAKLENELAKVEELGKIEVDKLYIDELGKVEDATAKTAVLAYLNEQGYKTKNISTTNETVKGIIVKDDTGNNIDEIGLLQGKNKKIRVTLDTEGDTNSKSYVTVLGKDYEITINSKDVKVSREENKEKKEITEGYEIKLIPPATGIEMKIENVIITEEQTITPETEITIQAKNDIGTYTFKLNENKTSTSRDVDVRVTENPEYATGLTISIENNAEAKVAVGKTIKLIANITPVGATDTVIWSIKSGEATVNDQGVVTANSNATVGNKIEVVAKCVRADKTETTVKEQTLILTVKDKVMENAKKAMPEGSTIDSTTNEDMGIVMIDSNGNEWVWVEVPSTVFTNAKNSTDYENIKADLITYASDYRDGYGTDEWYAMDGSKVVTASTEGLTDAQKALNNGCGLTYAEYTTKYQTMLSSIYTNKGFYIGRYEAGIEGSDTDTSLARYSRTAIISSSPKAVSKKDMIPYNFLTCSDAQQLANGMSVGNKTSSLMFGIQWNLVCKFLEVKGTSQSSIKEDSTGWGNYFNSSITLARGKYNINSLSSSSTWTLFNTDTDNYVINSVTATSKGILLTTGASEYTNKMNIYDFAGNEWEWTLEHDTANTYFPYSFCGGNYGDNGRRTPAFCRQFFIINYSLGAIGLRPSLY